MLPKTRRDCSCPDMIREAGGATGLSILIRPLGYSPEQSHTRATWRPVTTIMLALALLFQTDVTVPAVASAAPMTTERLADALLPPATFPPDAGIIAYFLTETFAAGAVLERPSFAPKKAVILAACIDGTFTLRYDSAIRIVRKNGAREDVPAGEAVVIAAGDA